MSKHTPGPWEVTEQDGILTIKAREGYPARVYGDCMDSRARLTTWANARLIAAAPDLLEALKKTLAGFDWHYRFGGARHDDSSKRIVEIAADAISKATGETKP